MMIDRDIKALGKPSRFFFMHSIIFFIFNKRYNFCENFQKALRNLPDVNIFLFSRSTNKFFKKFTLDCRVGVEMLDFLRFIFTPIEIVLQIFGLTHGRSILASWKLFSVAQTIRSHPFHNFVSEQTLKRLKIKNFRQIYRKS